MRSTNGHGHGRGAPQRPSSPSARNAGGTANKRDHKAMQNPSPPEPAATDNPPQRRLPSQREQRDERRENQLLREQVQAKSSKIQRTSGKRCGEMRVSPAGPRSSKTASGSATTGDKQDDAQNEPRQRAQPAEDQHSTLKPSTDPVSRRENTWSRHRNRNRARFEPIECRRPENRACGSWPVRRRGWDTRRERQTARAGDRRAAG